MIYLNLLPYKFRKELRLRHLYKNLFRFCFVLVFFTFFLASIFYISNRIFSSFYEMVDNTNFLIGRQVEDPLEVKDINLQINKTWDLLNNSSDWVKIISSTTAPFQGRVCLNSLDINKEAQKIYIQGVAQDRDSLLDLKNVLERSSYFSQLNFPIRDIFKKENINFQIEAKINIEK